MTTVDILYIALAIAALLFAGAVWFVALEVVMTLRKIQYLLSDVKYLTQGMHAFQNNIKNVISQKIESITASFFHKKEVKL